MFGRLNKIAQNILNLNRNAILQEVMSNSSIQAQMLDLTAKQMDAGLDANGQFIGNYSEVSVRVYGKEPGPIKLYDTGATRESIRIVAGSEGVVESADTNLHGKDLSNLFIPSLGLDSESLQELKPEINIRVVEIMKKQILQ